MAEAGEYWDRRAREDALYFIDNRLEYGNADQDRFWAGGVADLDKLLAILGVAVGSGEVVVDVGCGVGRLTRPLAARAKEVLALDVSSEMVARAREYNPELSNVQWLVGDGSSLAPIADATADACVSHVVFQHISDPEVTLGYVREMGRVLRAGGWAAFQVSNNPSMHRAPPGGLRQRVRAVLGLAPKGQRDPAWFGSGVELDALRSAADDGGLELERIEGEGTQYCLVLARRRRA
jgi:ubiquinone/menaquinone biosynthesis C-methylase UbiE